MSSENKEGQLQKQEKRIGNYIIGIYFLIKKKHWERELLARSNLQLI